MPRKPKAPKLRRRVIGLTAQPARPGWYTLVWADGTLHRENLSVDRCREALAVVRGNATLTDIWQWRLGVLLGEEPVPIQEAKGDADEPAADLGGDDRPQRSGPPADERAEREGLC